MGSFSDAEYKRMLLAFDRIYYLLPQRLVEFRDISGRATHLTFPAKLYAETSAFVPCGFDLDETHRQGILRATDSDLSGDGLRSAVEGIPSADLLYTWRVVNADAGFADGKSIALDPSQMASAHLLLLNKFLLAADALGSIPITGKAYVNRLLTLKYQNAEHAIGLHLPSVLPNQPRGADLRHGPFVAELISAFISDAELEAVSLADIAKYKHRNAALFEEFSLTVRTLVGEIGSLPAERSFQRDVQDLLATKVWKAQRDIQREMRSAFDANFLAGIKEAAKSEFAKTAVKAVGSALAIGVMPHLSPGALTWASALATGGAVAPWVVSELASTLAKRRDAKRNGLYYLLGFKQP